MLYVVIAFPQTCCIPIDRLRRSGKFIKLTYLIASFPLLQQFDISVHARTSVFLPQIVQQYDILLVQEVRDISRTAIATLLAAVNTQIG